MHGWNETPQELAERVKRVRAGWTDWLRQYHWSHVVHLTTGEMVEAGTQRAGLRTGGSTRASDWVQRRDAHRQHPCRRLRMVRGIWRVAAPAMPMEKLLRAFVEEFCRYCTQAAQRSVRFAFVGEGGALGRRPHIHALLYGTSTLDCTRLAQAWCYGRADVTVYDPRGGAAHYLTKEIGGRVLDYGVSRRMPPLRVDEPRPSSA